jgi:hypothetical protein
MEAKIDTEDQEVLDAYAKSVALQCSDLLLGVSLPELFMILAKEIENQSDQFEKRAKQNVDLSYILDDKVRYRRFAAGELRKLAGHRYAWRGR